MAGKLEVGLGANLKADSAEHRTLEACHRTCRRAAKILSNCASRCLSMAFPGQRSAHRECCAPQVLVPKAQRVVGRGTTLRPRSPWTTSPSPPHSFDFPKIHPVRGILVYKLALHLNNRPSFPKSDPQEMQSRHNRSHTAPPQACSKKGQLSTLGV